MEQLQKERWIEFSVALARCFKHHYGKKLFALQEEIESAIDWVCCNGIEQFVDWDHSKPPKNPAHGMNNSVSSRVSQYLWDAGLERERETKRGGIEVVHTALGERVLACVRAGFDVAVEPSAGVVGFSVGDLRRAFRGSIPDWVSEFFPPGALAEATDAQAVWL